jgi:thiamine-phosphate pyrophosphorylase
MTTEGAWHYVSVTEVRALIVIVTDREMAAAAGHTVTEVIGAALDGGAGVVLLREKDLPATDRRMLAEDLRVLTAGQGAELWVASDAALAKAVYADALHLAATDPWPAELAGDRRRPDWPDAEGIVRELRSRGRRDGIRIGRSCHTIAELRDAWREGADHATYSPVFPTGSKPGYGPALGLDGLAEGVRAVLPLPLIALGGVGPGRARACLEAGATVAMMGAVMGADDPAAVVRSVFEEITEVRT